MKVLFISDSLGSPTQQRGIHNFSMSLMEALQSLGAEVTLVVERPASYATTHKLNSNITAVAETERSIELSEFLRYFSYRKFAMPIYNIAQWPVPKFLFQLAGGVYFAVVKSMNGGHTTIKNDPMAVEFVPRNAYQLRIPQYFMAAPLAYSEMVFRAAFGMRPSSIDAKGFDLCVVDTPSYCRISGIAPERIVAVVHDVIPLRDPSTRPFWRKLFFKKIEATLAMKANFAFVSEFSRKTFISLFPDYKMRSSAVIYPALGRAAMQRAEHLLKGKANSPNRSSATTKVGKEIPQGSDMKDGWNHLLPYFVTVATDEPRKNVETLVEAFSALKDKANMIIIGHVESKNYLNKKTGEPKNVRFTGYVSDDEKSDLILGSVGMIFPSFAEGFGIPIIEGALFEKPVICSDIEVFREITGGNAFFFDPYSSSSLVTTIDQVMSSEPEAKQVAVNLRAHCLKLFNEQASSARLQSYLSEIGILDRR